MSSNVKLFGDDISLFSIVHDVHASPRELNDDLKKINKWAFQWKMNFIPDPSNQAQVIFGRKIKKLQHSSLVFNNNNVLKVSSQKHLGVTLDVKLTFHENLNNVLNKVQTSKTNKTISLLRKLQKLLSGSTLITINKAFVRSHLESFRVCCVYRKHFLFYKVLNNEHLQYLFDLTTVRRTLY